MVIIDDFRAADDDSRLLAGFVASEIQDSPVMMILSFRDAETSATQTAIYGELCRFGPQLALKGLSETEVREIVVNATGDGADSRFIS